MKLFKKLGLLLLASALVSAQEARITMSVEQADIRTVLRAFAEVGKVNIITTPSVTQKVSFNIKDVPWRLALKSLLDAYGLAMIESEGMITIMTQQEFSQLKTAADLDLKVLKVRYADARKVAEVLKSQLSPRGDIKIDESSNALIVTDLRVNLYKVEDLLSQIDKPYPQVLITGRIVEVDYNESRKLGTELRAMRFGNPAFEGATYDLPQHSSPMAENPTYLTVHYLGSKALQVEAAIDALEGQSKANTISEPKIMVLDNEKASIYSKIRVPVTSRDMAGNTIVQFEETGIQLEVTPHIIPDGKVVMNIKTETGDLTGYSATGQPITSKRGAETKITVSDGETVMIGGVIIEKDKRAKQGMPLILRIPVIRYLFGRDQVEKGKSEILIFLTPNIVKE
jgi:type IV pilus secretin PilQ/predicted competence protein